MEPVSLPAPSALRPLPSRALVVAVVPVVLLTVVFLLGPSAPPAAAQGPQEPNAASTDVLRVGTKEAPPFALRGEDGQWRGIAIDLWASVAADLGVEYELVETDLEGLLTGLEAGELDLSVAALTMTAERETRVDFSHAFHTSGLGIATRTHAVRGWWQTVTQVFDPGFLRVVAILAVTLLAIGVLVWLFERRANEQFGGSPLRGIGASFWWSAVTMTTVGYGDKAPVTFGGRFVALVWMFASIITISAFTAAIASSLTVARLAAPVEGPEDLPQVQVAAVASSTGASALERRHIRHRTFPTAEEAVAALATGEVDAVVHDQPILAHLIQADDSGELGVLEETFERQDYAIALPEDSALTEPIDRRILATVADPAWENVLVRYLGR